MRQWLFSNIALRNHLVLHNNYDQTQVQHTADDVTSTYILNTNDIPQTQLVIYGHKPNKPRTHDNTHT